MVGVWIAPVIAHEMMTLVFFAILLPLRSEAVRLGCRDCGSRGRWLSSRECAVLPDRRLRTGHIRPPHPVRTLALRPVRVQLGRRCGGPVRTSNCGHGRRSLSVWLSLIYYPGAMTLRSEEHTS